MAQGKPIPTRFDDDVTAAIQMLQKRTGVAQSDIIRRCVAFALKEYKRTGDISFLFDGESVGAVAEVPTGYKDSFERLAQALEKHVETSGEILKRLDQQGKT